MTLFISQRHNKMVDFWLLIAELSYRCTTHKITIGREKKKVSQKPSKSSRQWKKASMTRFIDFSYQWSNICTDGFPLRVQLSSYGTYFHITHKKKLNTAGGKEEGDKSGISFFFFCDFFLGWIFFSHKTWNYYSRYIKRVSDLRIKILQMNEAID